MNSSIITWDNKVRIFCLHSADSNLSNPCVILLNDLSSNAVTITRKIDVFNNYTLVIVINRLSSCRGNCLTCKGCINFRCRDDEWCLTSQTKYDFFIIIINTARCSECSSIECLTFSDCNVIHVSNKSAGTITVSTDIARTITEVCAIACIATCLYTIYICRHYRFVSNDCNVVPSVSGSKYVTRKNDVSCVIKDTQCLINHSDIQTSGCTSSTKVKDILCTRNTCRIDPCLKGEVTCTKVKVIRINLLQIRVGDKLQRLIAVSEIFVVNNNALSNTTLINQSRVCQIFTILKSCTNAIRISEQPLQTRVNTRKFEGCTRSFSSDVVTKFKQTRRLVLIGNLVNTNSFTLAE